MTASGWLIPGSEPRPRTSIWGRRVWHAEGDQPGGQLLQRLPEGVEHLNRSRVPLGRGRRGEHGDGDLLIVHVDAGHGRMDDLPGVSRTRVRNWTRARRPR